MHCQTLEILGWVPLFGRLGLSDDIGHGGSLWPSMLGNGPGVCCLVHPWRWRVHGMCYPVPGALQNRLICFPGWWHPWCWQVWVRRWYEHPWKWGMGLDRCMTEHWVQYWTASCRSWRWRRNRSYLWWGQSRVGPLLNGLAESLNCGHLIVTGNVRGVV